MRSRADGTVEPGSAPMPLGVSAPARRRFAFECFDATEHAPHLAGALGDALASELFARGWISHGEGRDVVVTAAGARGLRREFGFAPGVPGKRDHRQRNDRHPRGSPP